MLKGKHILVTGGSRGLGRSLCLTFAAQGADVAFNYNADDEGAAETVQRAGDLGSEIQAFKNSVLDRQTIADMVASLEEKWGAVDILVNNAGISQMLPMALLEEEDWDRVLEMTTDPDPRVRSNVLHTLGDGSPRDLRERIVAVLRGMYHDPDLRLRRRVRQLLAHHRRTGEINIL